MRNPSAFPCSAASRALASVWAKTGCASSTVAARMQVQIILIFMKAILVQPIGLSSDAEHKAIFCGRLLGRRKLQPRHAAGDAAGDCKA